MLDKSEKNFNRKHGNSTVKQKNDNDGIFHNYI